MKFEHIERDLENLLLRDIIIFNDKKTFKKGKFIIYKVKEFYYVLTLQNDKNELHTPTPDSFLDGITRREVIKIAKSKGIKVIERKIKPSEMKNFDGCFLTGTAAEVTPVSQIEDNQFKICDVITDLSESYKTLVRKKSAA